MPHLLEKNSAGRWCLYRTLKGEGPSWAGAGQQVPTQAIHKARAVLAPTPSLFLQALYCHLLENCHNKSSNLSHPWGKSSPFRRAHVQCATCMTIHCEPCGSAKKCWVTGALEVGVYGGSGRRGSRPSGFWRSPQLSSTCSSLLTAPPLLTSHLLWL